MHGRMQVNLLLCAVEIMSRTLAIYAGMHERFVRPRWKHILLLICSELRAKQAKSPIRSTTRDLTRRLESGAELARLQARRAILKREAEEVGMVSALFSSLKHPTPYHRVWVKVRGPCVFCRHSPIV